MIDHWRELGEYYGYPPCCIDHFVTHAVTDLPWLRYRLSLNASRHPSCGTGFVPCPKCARHTAKFGVFGLAMWLGRNLFDPWDLLHCVPSYLTLPKDVLHSKWGWKWFILSPE